MAWPVSDDYLAAVQRSHRIAVRTEVLRNGSTLDVLAVESGRVDIDVNQSTRRSASIPVLDANGELVPGAPEDLLNVLGNELRLWRGIDFGDDRPGIPDGIAPTGCELVPLITGPIFENTADDQGAGIALELQVYDRGRLVADNAWVDPYAPTAGTPYTDAILAGILDRLPATLPVRTDNVDVSDLTTPNGLGTGNNSTDDPMATLRRWARVIGFDLGFDPLGNPFLRGVPDRLNDQPAATYSSLEHGLYAAGKRISRERVYNRVIVTGESPGGGAPVRAVADDTDPASPTYVGGIMGPRPFQYQSSLIRTQTQADRVATALLRRKAGMSEEVKFGTLVDSRLDGFDLIELVHPRLKLADRYLIDTLTIPLAPEDLAEGTVRRRIALV